MLARLDWQGTAESQSRCGFVRQLDANLAYLSDACDKTGSRQVAGSLAQQVTGRAGIQTSDWV